MTANLAAFLRARLDERHHDALMAAGPIGSDWRSGPFAGSIHGPGPLGGDLMRVPDQVGDHIIGNDPSYVLADIDAKRRIIDEFETRDNDVDLMLGPDTLKQREWSGLRLALRLLALPFRDHADYQQEWTV